MWGELLSTGEYYTLLGPEEQVLWETGHQMYLRINISEQTTTSMK